MDVPRIAVLNSSLGIAHRGGERVLVEVARGLSEHYDVTVFSGGAFEGARRLPTIARHRVLARIGVASAELYIKHWRIALVLIAALAAILPGGDPFSMLLLMLPQVLLYGLGIVLAKRFGGPPLWAREAWADADDDTAAGEA